MEATLHTRPMHAIKSLVANDSHWFEPATMRFFASRVCQRAYVGPHGTTFVSSEQFRPTHGDPAPRMYSVQRVYQDSNGRWTVETVGAFQAYATRREADHAARQYAERGTI